MQLPSLLMLLGIGLIEVGFIGPSEWVNMIRRDAMLWRVIADVGSSVAYNLWSTSSPFTPSHCSRLPLRPASTYRYQTGAKPGQPRRPPRPSREHHFLHPVRSRTVNQNHQITFFNHFAEAIPALPPPMSSTKTSRCSLTCANLSKRQAPQPTRRTLIQILSRVAFVRWTISRCSTARRTYRTRVDFR